jgi:hypothetical protein
MRARGKRSDFNFPTGGNDVSPCKLSYLESDSKPLVKKRDDLYINPSRKRVFPWRRIYPDEIGVLNPRIAGFPPKREIAPLRLLEPQSEHV